MSSEFLAGFISGIAGLVVGSPLDVIKTNDQTTVASHVKISIYRPTTWFAGLLLPTAGLGFLNAMLFWSYGLVVRLCSSEYTRGHHSLFVSFMAGLFAGACVCFVSVPTELVKVQAQTTDESSIEVMQRILQENGLLGFCQGGLVTILRDSIGYAFYFLAYDGLLDLLCSITKHKQWAVLLAGGLAGCISWFSIYPLDVVKTRLQTHIHTENDLIIHHERPDWGLGVTESQVLGIMNCTRALWEEDGFPGFFKGLPVALLRAFVVNAVIFWVNGLILG